MLYVTVIRENGKVVSAKAGAAKGAESRWDWKTFEQAAEVAAALGEGFIATDAGEWVSPRFDVIHLPKVGEEVSKAFNGDYYPCGKIIKISKGPMYRRIETDTGDVFYRRKQSGSWVNQGTWSLLPGHVSRLNPEF